jgi:hypothetical protein
VASVPSHPKEKKENPPLPTRRQKALSIQKICSFPVLTNDILHGLYRSNSCSRVLLRHCQSLTYSCDLSVQVACSQEPTMGPCQMNPVITHSS